MSDDIVKKLLESLTPEQKNELISGLLESNVKSDAPEQEAKQLEKSVPEVKEDFKVVRTTPDNTRKAPVRARKNQWVDIGEDKDLDFDYEKFEKMKTPRKRSQPRKKDVECHVCGKTFSVNENLVYGEYMRCNRCTGR